MQSDSQTEQTKAVTKCHKYIIRHTVVQLLHTLLYDSQLSGHPSFGVGTLMETQEGHGAIDCHKTPARGTPPWVHKGKVNKMA